MNEVIIHRGRTPHLAALDVSVGSRFLTSAVADGMIVSTPTGSTAYSLSSGGSIVHPLVSSLLLTPICPRSLSFRPLVLPLAHSNPISLRLGDRNRSEEVDVSIDGVMQKIGLTKGTEVRVWGEGVRDSKGVWRGGVPSVVRGAGLDDGGEDHWVGGLNGLLKFNYPFGEG
jgi:NADH kinase